MITWLTLWICNVVLLLLTFWHFKNKIAPLNRMPEVYELQLNACQEGEDKEQESIYQMNWQKHFYIHKSLFLSEYFLFFIMVLTFFIMLSEHSYL